MKEQILNAKLCMPEFPRAVIRREKLTERMHAMAGPAVMLHAGSGYGKSFVMAEYIQRFQEPYIWYQLDRTDDSMEIFLCYFEAALQQHLKDFRFRQDGSEWTPERIEGMAKQVLGELERWKGKLTIILDDFQYIQNEHLYDFLNCFIRFLSRNIRIFLLTKGRFPGFLTKLLLQGRISILDKEDLKVTKEELEKHLEYQDLQEEQSEAYAPLERIMYYSQGWMTAVADCLQMRTWDTDLLHSVNVLNYIQYEIWNGLCRREQIFMQESAALSVLTPEICNRVLGIEDAEEMLEHFVEEQLLTERGDDLVYQYHPLLKAFLYTRTEKEERLEISRREDMLYRKRSNFKRVISFAEMEKPSCSLSCFGGICVCEEEKGITLHWRTRKTKEMFGYFWEHADRPLSKDEVIEALWQEADGQKIESLFHTTLSYLKRSFSEVGISNLIRTDNKKYIMDSSRFRSDTEALQGLYEKWKKGIFSRGLEGDYQYLNQIYAGEYMKEIDGFWVISRREYYQKLYLKCCKLLVQQGRALRLHDLNVHILKHAIELDPYSEELNEMLIEGLGALGEFQLAKQCYENYTRLLKEDLNITISRQVRESYQNNILRRSG